jgi:hypothetical protein
VFPFAEHNDSAEGSLSVADALRAFSIRSMVAAKQADRSKAPLDASVADHTSKFINTGFISQAGERSEVRRLIAMPHASDSHCEEAQQQTEQTNRNGQRNDGDRQRQHHDP